VALISLSTAKSSAEAVSTALAPSKGAMMSNHARTNRFIHCSPNKSYDGGRYMPQRIQSIALWQQTLVFLRHNSNRLRRQALRRRRRFVVKCYRPLPYVYDYRSKLR